MTKFEVLEDHEAMLVQLRPKTKGPTDTNKEIIEAILSGKTVFLPGKTPTTISTLRYWVEKSGRKLTTRSAKRDGVSGLYAWMTPSK